MHVIDEKLQNLECPESLFVPIAGLIGRTRLTQFLQGTAQLDANLVDKLVAVLDEMLDLSKQHLSLQTGRTQRTSPRHRLQRS